MSENQSDEKVQYSGTTLGSYIKIVAIDSSLFGNIIIIITFNIIRISAGWMYDCLFPYDHYFHISHTCMDINIDMLNCDVYLDHILMCVHK